MTVTLALIGPDGRELEGHGYARVNYVDAKDDGRHRRYRTVMFFPKATGDWQPVHAVRMHADGKSVDIITFGCPTRIFEGDMFRIVFEEEYPGVWRVKP